MAPTDPLWRFPGWMMAWRNFKRNKVRSALATLGIVIGVIAIASLGMVGAAIQYSTAENLGSLTNQVTVTPGQDNRNDGLTETDVRDLEQVAVDEVVVPQKSARTTLAGNGAERQVRVTGVTRASALYEASAGEVPDRLRSGALVGEQVADDLALEPGDPVVYDGATYRIRGIVEPRGFGPGGGGTLVLPLSALADRQYYDTVTVVAADGAAAVEYADRVEEAVNRRREVVAVTTNEDIQENIEQFTSTLNLALLGIGSISLIVASVAILNIMLMSTIERRGEIGLLRAVGVRRGEVLRMILAEAALLGLLGAGFGAAVSLGVGLLINDLLFGDPFLVLTWNSARYLVYGFGFGFAASLLSGVYPAWKAANDPPVEALRG
jgi:putative ABC transport system permease protein